MCDLRALTRAALLEALSQYPGDKEPKGQLQGVKTPQVALEWQRWDDVFFLTQVLGNVRKKSLLLDGFFFPNILQYSQTCVRRSHG